MAIQKIVWCVVCMLFTWSLYEIMRLADRSYWTEVQEQRDLEDELIAGRSKKGGE